MIFNDLSLKLILLWAYFYTNKTYLHISYFDTMRKMKGDAVRRN